MRISKSVILLSAAVVAFSVSGAVTASATSSAPPKSVGVCAKKSGGALRMLEAGNVAKSQFGKCKSTEARVVLPTTTVKGAKGDTGAKGGPGPAGVKGETGPAGPKGDAGTGKDGRGFDGAPFNMTFAGAGPWKCSWKADTETLACVTPE